MILRHPFFVLEVGYGLLLEINESEHHTLSHVKHWWHVINQEKFTFVNVNVTFSLSLYGNIN